MVAKQENAFSSWNKVKEISLASAQNLLIKIVIHEFIIPKGTHLADRANMSEVGGICTCFDPIIGGTLFLRQNGV